MKANFRCVSKHTRGNSFHLLSISYFRHLFVTIDFEIFRNVADFGFKRKVKKFTIFFHIYVFINWFIRRCLRKLIFFSSFIKLMSTRRRFFFLLFINSQLFLLSTTSLSFSNSSLFILELLCLYIIFHAHKILNFLTKNLNTIWPKFCFSLLFLLIH